MNALAGLAPPDRLTGLALLVLADIAAVVLLAWLACAVALRRNAAARCVAWQTALAAVLLSPLVVAALELGGWTLPIVAAHGPIVARSPSRPSVAVPGPSRHPASRQRRGKTASTSPARLVVQTRTTVVPLDPPSPDLPPRPAASWRASVPTLLAAVWVAGTLALLARLAVGLARLGALRRSSRAIDDPDLLALRDEAAGHVGLAQPPLLATTPALAGPIACGVLHPAILLPEALVATPGRIGDILIHEAAHLARRDPLVGLLQRLAGALFWIHPLVHVLNRELARAREEVCDNHVLRRGSAVRYAKTLVDLSESFEAPPALLAAGLFPSHWDLADRIDGLLDRRRSLMTRANPWTRAGLAAVLLGSTLALAAVRTRAVAAPQEPAPAAPAAKAADAAPAAAPAPAPKAPDGPLTEEDVAGRVVDAEGKPIEGALVDAWSWYPGHETRTDRDGRFRLRAFTGPGYDPKGGAQMRFTKDGYSPVTLGEASGRTLGGTKDLEVKLTNTTYFEGRIFAPGGRPFDGAMIRASNPMKNSDGQVVGQLWTETSTDLGGDYRLYVEPGTFDIQVRVPGLGAFRRSGQTIAADEVKKLDLPLERGVEFRAKVVDSVTGKPVEGLRLFHWLAVDKYDLDARSGPDGTIRFDDVFPGRLDFSVEGPGIKQEMEGLTLVGDGPWYARWWSEQAVSEWNRKQLIDNDSVGAMVAQAKAEGNQALLAMIERYRLDRPWQRNFDNLDFDLQPGMEPVTIVVEEAVIVRGRVVDPEGQPVAGATVAPALTGSGNSLTGDTRFSVMSGPDGRFAMLLPASGERPYNLVAHDGKYLEWRHWANGVLEPIRTKPGQVLEGVEIALSRPATVRGRVVDASGKPVAGREVRASAGDRLENRYYDPTTSTDAEGRFELKFIRPGEQFIQVAPFWLLAPDAPEKSSVTATLEPGQTLEGVELVGQPEHGGAAIEVTIPAP